MGMEKDDVQFKRIKHIMSNTFPPTTALFFMPRQNQSQKPKKKVGGSVLRRFGSVSDSMISDKSPQCPHFQHRTLQLLRSLGDGYRNKEICVI